MKIAVCCPHTGTLKAETARCLGLMLILTSTARITYNGAPARPEIHLLFSGDGPLDWKRTQLAHAALAGGSDYLLWLDSDQTFPPDALVRLMAHDKPIVAGIYASRHAPNSASLDFDGKPVPRRSGLQAVGAIGFGFALIKTPVLERIPHPWFTTRISPEGQLICGEDVHFCNQARSAGIPVYVDHDLEIGHISEQVLTLQREGAGEGAAPPEAGRP
jgi:GT2 family glycosyltransferase